MTQALLNNLNNLYNGIHSVENFGMGEINKKFDKILDSKTINKDTEQEFEINTKDNLVQSKENIENSEENLSKDSEFSESNKNKEDKKTEVKQTLDEIVMSIAAESVIDDSITAKNQENISDELITEDENTNTITGEEPTMQKELALENPTMAEMLLNLKMHVQQNVPAENEITEPEPKIPSTNVSVESEEVTEEFKFDIKEELSLKEEKQWDDIIDEKMAEDLNIESVTSETTPENSNQNNFMQNQSTQEQMAKIMIQGDISYNDVKVDGIVQAEAKTEITSGNILEQITKQMEGMYNNLKVNIVLNPQSLGKVTLQILNTKEGLTAQFVVSNEDVKNILYKGLNGLKENLISHGVNVDNITIKLNESEMYNSESTEDWTEQEGSRGGNKEQNPKHQKQDKKLFEQTMFEINNKNS